MLPMMMIKEILEHNERLERFNAMTPDQQAQELRLREVQALERIAVAQTNLAQDRHYHLHHHIL